MTSSMITSSLSSVELTTSEHRLSTRTFVDRAGSRASPIQPAHRPTPAPESAADDDVWTEAFRRPAYLLLPEQCITSASGRSILIVAASVS